MRTAQIVEGVKAERLKREAAREVRRRATTEKLIKAQRLAATEKDKEVAKKGGQKKKKKETYYDVDYTRRPTKSELARNAKGHAGRIDGVEQNIEQEYTDTMTQWKAATEMTSETHIRDFG